MEYCLCSITAILSQVGTPENGLLVTQYYLPGWTDKTANIEPVRFIQFILMIREAAESDDVGPIVVHCRLVKSVSIHAIG